MSKATTAALLSALVLPGAGHLYLKSYPRAIALIIIVIGAVVTLIKIATQKAYSLLDKLEAEGGIITQERILELATQASTDNSGSSAATTATLLLVACWIIALIDAYRLGSKQ